MYNEIDITTDKVYSHCPGTIVNVSREGIGYSCIVLYDDSHGMMYKHLKQINVDDGLVISFGFQLGVADRFVTVTKLTKEQSNYPVRYSGITLFKNDPTSIIKNGYDEFITKSTALTASDEVLVEADTIEDTAYERLTNNKG